MAASRSSCARSRRERRGSTASQSTRFAASSAACRSGGSNGGVMAGCCANSAGQHSADAPLHKLCSTVQHSDGSSPGCKAEAWQGSSQQHHHARPPASG